MDIYSLLWREDATKNRIRLVRAECICRRDAKVLTKKNATILGRIAGMDQTSNDDEPSSSWGEIGRENRKPYVTNKLLSMMKKWNRTKSDWCLRVEVGELLKCLPQKLLWYSGRLRCQRPSDPTCRSAWHITMELRYNFWQENWSPPFPRHGNLLIRRHSCSFASSRTAQTSTCQSE